jgi:hypothetical protein
MTIATVEPETYSPSPRVTSVASDDWNRADGDVRVDVSVAVPVNSHWRDDYATTSTGFLVAEPEEPLREKFARLKREWLDDIEDQSVIDFMHGSYQQIVGMGQDAIPFLLDELPRESGHWFWALRAIAGRDVAGPTDDYDAAAAAWLEWGRKRGVIRASVRS